MSGASPQTRVLVMTMSDDDDAVVAAMRAGARGFVVKGAGRAELIHVGTHRRRRAAQRSARPSRTVSVATSAGLASQPSREVFPHLSEREREVLELVAQGHDNRRIARELFISDKTVRNHVSSLFTKLDVPDRAEAIRRARQAGLGDVH